MVRVLVVEHESVCPPAHAGTWLEEAGAELVVCRPWAGDELPAGPAAYDALLVLGGSMNADDDALHSWLGPLKRLIRETVGAGVPVLGICLGHQLVGHALGGVVEPNRLGQQVGVLDVGWLPEAAEDPLVGVIASGPARGIQWNHDLVVSVPEGTVPLARTPRGELQVVRFADRAWGVQLHPEADEHVVAAWADGDRAEHLERGLDTDALLADVAGARDELDATWRPVLRRFLAIAREAR